MRRAQTISKANIEISLKELILASLVSFLFSVIGVHVIPKIFNYASVNYVQLEKSLVIFTAFLIVGILISIFLLIKEIGKCSVGTAIKRTVVILIAFAVTVVIASLLSGLAAEYIYSRNVGIKSLNDIKTIIDIISKVILLVIAPLGIILFWRIAEGETGKSKGSEHKIRDTFKSHIKLIILTIIITLTATSFNLIPEGGISIAIKTMVLTILGVVSFYITRVICQNRKMAHKNNLDNQAVEGVKA